MSRNLKYKPLSQSRVNSILANNPSSKVSSSSSSSSPTVVARPSMPPSPAIVTLRRSDNFDSLHPEDNLKSFLGFARDVISRYEDNQKLQLDLETETQDLLHYIELSPNMNACEYTKMCIKLRDVRRQRRACKNEIDLLEPLYTYLKDKVVINQLAAIQGKCKTSKEAIGLRAYTLRTDVIR